jgi:hypothetical protein|tara:strand:+ start:212 stop:385 length:174 start_codon:yes stop_codon:yes gene_type:complete
MKLQLLINFLPMIVFFLYAIVGICYILKKDYAWALVWISYALANVGLIWVGMRGETF